MYDTMQERKKIYNEVITSQVETSRPVRYISMKVYKGCSIRGIRLADANGDYLLDVTWYANGNEGSWVTHTIPNGSEIIGLKCNTCSNPSNILRIGFVLWTPKAARWDLY